MPPDTTESAPSGPTDPAKTEPLACVSCRARKLKCDRTKPACTRCVKVSNECVYPESRRKPTFKRRNVKELEARLAQVEDYLKEVNKNSSEGKTDDDSPVHQTQPDANFFDVDFSSTFPQAINNSSDANFSSFTSPEFTQQSHNCDVPFNTQLISMGLSEPLPPDDVMEELNSIFFTHQYRMIPIVHPGRYMQSFYGPVSRKPPMCLRYAIWALAAAGNAKYDQYHEIFYRRSRQYVEVDLMKGHGDAFVSVQHAQTWCLIAFYEARMLLFTRSTISVANCVRLCHMIGLDRLDGDPLGMPPALGPALTWAELEERRRIFWGVFAADAHCSISTGWPSLIDCEDIATRLPASEEAFNEDRKEEAPFLDDAIQGAQYAGFAGTIVTCQINKMILRHVNRSKPDSRCEDVMHGSFWTRHRDLDNTLSSLFMFLPEKFRLPENIRDVSALHLNLNLHAAVICLHHAAIEKADRYNLPAHVKQGSVARLRAAAEEVVNTMRLTSNVTMFFKSPLSALALYCTTTVYIYMGKENPATGLSAVDLSNLQLILQSMEAIARVHVITRTFLHQCCLDIEKNGLGSVIQMPSLRRYRDAFGPAKSHIPMVARSSVSQHTAASPIVSPTERELDAAQTRLEKVSRVMGIGVNIGKPCFQALLGSVHRNISPTDGPDFITNKRKRANESPGPDMMPKLRTSGPLSLNMNPNFKGTGMWPASFSPRMASGVVSLPDRTNSSAASSPVNYGSNPGSYTRTASGSSHTSPDIGLGNSAEENRIDLRAFQERISTPIWQSTEDALFTQMASNEMPDESDPWGILNVGELNWDIACLPAGN
ncbi:ZnII2Cys6 transcription factor [Fusarium acuminatum]|uniref:ZnII2Cys6 transcription factor n=1 Tax=Fusarium acuminatum TaxID=5515 RepID=A0ABZ2WQI0_9HYPO